ncbi:MAG: oligosaccharide flippase family protein, partial [Planctomycetota bacterium]
MIAALMVLQRAIGFARSFYVCDVLPSEQVGRWDLAFNFFVLAAPLAVFGIPGSFGRYVATYEETGQSNRFFRNSLVACLILTSVFAFIFWSFHQSIALYFLGSAGDATLAKWLAIGLPAVVFFNFATSWFTGRRFNRYVFRMQFAQTLFFALFCVLFLQAWGAIGEAVIAAYLGSCLVGLV